MKEHDLILAKVRENLERGRAVATGIGVFAAVIEITEPQQDEYSGLSSARGKQILLRRRLEEGSLFGQDLSGRWELPGGGVELADFEPGKYLSAVVNTLRRELQEETGLNLSEDLSPSQLFPAWIFNRERSTIDLAFVTILYASSVEETNEYRAFLNAGDVRFFRLEDLGSIEIVSQRMRYLITTALHAA